jgi:hypothetical protein
MSEEIALDFTEQLLIFEKCGNVYAREEFVQAKEVSLYTRSSRGLHLLTILDSWTETSDLVRVHSPEQAAVSIGQNREAAFIDRIRRLGSPQDPSKIGKK